MKFTRLELPEQENLLFVASVEEDNYEIQLDKYNTFTSVFMTIIEGTHPFVTNKGNFIENVSQFVEKEEMELSFLKED